MCATTDMIELYRILENEDIERLESAEISYLQLRFMERLSREEIAALLERGDEEIASIAGRFAQSRYQPSARSTI